MRSGPKLPVCKIRLFTGHHKSRMGKFMNYPNLQFFFKKMTYFGLSEVPTWNCRLSFLMQFQIFQFSILGRQKFKQGTKNYKSDPGCFNLFSSIRSEKSKKVDFISSLKWNHLWFMWFSNKKQVVFLFH